MVFWNLIKLTSVDGVSGVTGHVYKVNCEVLRFPCCASHLPQLYSHSKT